MKPEQGKVYVSQTDPTVRLYIEAVNIIDADPEDDTPESFMVEACDEKDRCNEGGWGIEFFGDEWEEFADKHRLTLAA